MIDALIPLLEGSFAGLGDERAEWSPKRDIR